VTTAVDTGYSVLSVWLQTIALPSSAHFLIRNVMSLQWILLPGVHQKLNRTELYLVLSEPSGCAEWVCLPEMG